MAEPKKKAKVKIPKGNPPGFVQGVFETPEYPDWPGVSREWCKYHHHCSHKTEDCTAPNSIGAQQKTGLKNPPGMTDEEWVKLNAKKKNEGG